MGCLSTTTMMEIRNWKYTTRTEREMEKRLIFTRTENAEAGNKLQEWRIGWVNFHY